MSPLSLRSNRPQRTLRHALLVDELEARTAHAHDRLDERLAYRVHFGPGIVAPRGREPGPRALASRALALPMLKESFVNHRSPLFIGTRWLGL